jgi:hypothetical protein
MYIALKLGVFSGTPLMRAPALTAAKQLSARNTLAYFLPGGISDEEKESYSFDTWGQYYKTFLVCNITDFCNKLECLSLASFSSLG